MPPPLSRRAFSIVVCEHAALGQAQIQRAFDDAHIANTLHFVDDVDALGDYLYQRGAFSGERGTAPRPGLMLVHVGAAREHGRAALRALRDDHALRDIPMVMLVDSPAEEIEVRRWELSVPAFITMPVTMNRVIAALRRLGRHWFELVDRAPSGA